MKRRTIVVLILAFTMLGCAVIWLTGWGSHEWRLASGLSKLADTSTKDNPFAEYDLVCFNHNNGNVLQEFGGEGRRLGRDFFAYDRCGKENSCCGFPSNFAGVIGTVRDGEMTCAAVQISFVLTQERAFCAKPSSLVVKNRIFEKAEFQAGRGWKSVPGTSYFEVGEKQP